MAQNTIDFSADLSGTQLLDNQLTPMMANILTQNSGTSRPAYAQIGTLWLDTTTTPWVLKVYNGTSDIIMGTLNSTTLRFNPVAESFVPLYVAPAGVGGTANNLTLTPPVPVTAYSLGMILVFAPASNNTGGVTVNVGGLGAKTVIRRNASPLQAGEFVAGFLTMLVYDGTNFQQIGGSGGVVPIPNALQIGGLLRASAAGAFNWWIGSTTVPSAATVDLTASAGPVVLISGTTTITSLGVPATSGDIRYVTFVGAMTLTHDANALILPTSSNIVTANGDCAIFSSRFGLGWRCISYIRASGKPLVGPTAAEITNSTAAGRALLTAVDAKAQRTSIGRAQLLSAGFSIPNNTALVIDVSALAGLSGIISIATTVPTTASGQVAFRCPSGSAGVKLSGPATFVATTGILTGTTGSVGNVTVSAHTDSNVYIENRVGFTLVGSYLLQEAG